MASIASVRRRQWLATGGVGLATVAAFGSYRMFFPASAPIGLDLTPEALERARALLARHPSVDAHAHPGRTFVDGAQHLSGLIWIYARLGTFEKRTIAEMQAGGLSAASFAAVADFQTLAPVGDSLASVRAFEPGEAWASYKHQIGNLQSLATRGLVHTILTSSDFATARANGKVGALLTVEGGDFLEGKPERVAEAYADGVRSITLMHYRNNELGDTITGKAVHGRLSDAGVAIVKAMNDTGMLIDVAHASPATAMGAIAASTQPVMASHVHIHGPQLTHPRFIPLFMAKAIAEKGGGVLGAWPTGIGITNLNGFIDRTFELIDAVGIDHVCLGTDMDANYKPVFDTYTKLPHYVAGLLQRGLQEVDVAKLIGGNFLRIFTTVQAGRR